MDETESAEVVTAGQRLREAREAKGVSIEEIAAQTRIPTRHLASLETGDWDKLPAATYSIGFAKNYASAVGLDRNEIGDQLRAEMGGSRPVFASPEVYEAADPARTMPKGLVFGTLGLLVLVVLGLMWVSNRSLEPDPVPEPANLAAPVETPVAAAPQPSAPTATGPVVLTATDAVWLQIKDGSTVLKQGQMERGQSFEIPSTATAPVLTTGKPEALSISVGGQPAPAVGQPGRTVSGASLKAADLMQAASGATSAPSTNAQSGVQPAAPPRAAPRQAAPPASTGQSVEPAAPAGGDAPVASPGTPGEAATQL